MSLPWMRMSFTMTLGVACSSEVEVELETTPPPPTAIVEHVTRIPHLATYPCGETCHDDLHPNPTPRELTVFHAGRVLDHGSALRWCAACHASHDIDRLRLLNGELLSFDESHQICAQCHGPKHRDWTQGLHGLQTGGWTGTV